MGTKVTKTITINKPVAEVWAYVMQMENWPDWYVGLHSMSDFSGPNEPGTTYVAKFDLAGMTTVDFKGTIVEVDPEKRWVGDTVGMIDSRSEWDYESADGSTTITSTVDYTVSGSVLGKIADKLFLGKQLAADLQTSLDNIKNKIEG